MIPRELISLTVWDPTKPTRTTSHATIVTKTIAATRSTSTFQTSLNTTSNSINVNISATRTWIARGTTRGSVTTASPPKPAKKPKDKASGSRGEKEGILSLLRSLYLTYRFIKGTRWRNLSSSVVVTWVKTNVMTHDIILTLILTFTHTCRFILWTRE